VYAGSGTWIANPINNDWNTAANWSSNTVPGSLDTATFEVSAITDISISVSRGVNWLLLDSGASAYSFTALPGVALDVGSGGITNLSGVEQNFIAQTDSAGQWGIFAITQFGGIFGDGVVFTQYGAKLAGINGGAVFFTAGDTSAGTASFHNLGGTVSGAGGGIVVIESFSDAGESTIINEGGEVSGAEGGQTIFQIADPSAASATIIANGSSVSGASGGLISFYYHSVGGDSTLIANGGSNGGGGGAIFFRDNSDGGKARVEVFGNGSLGRVAQIASGEK